METVEKLREEVRNAIRAAAPSLAEVEYGSARSSAAFPYAVFTLEEVSFEDNSSLQELEVDIVDYGTDTAPAETIAGQIQQALDHCYIVVDEFVAAFYRERRQPLYEDDKKVIKRRLTFQVRLHERSS